MIRFLVFLVILAAFTLGLTLVMERPGTIHVEWLGYVVDTPVLVGLAGVLLLAVAIGLLWTLFRFVFRIPSLLSYGGRMRRRNRGLSALSRGMVAAGAGDARAAQRAADEAVRLLPSEPLSLLLKAQAAQLNGDRDEAASAFTQMLDTPGTRLLGLRGLHIEARRRGDAEAAHDLAQEAHKLSPVPWAGQAVLDHKTAQADWEGALATVEANLAARSTDRKTAARHRAVLRTAVALDKATAEPDAALTLAREALKDAPDLVPAAALAGRLLARRGDLRKASRVIEAAWIRQPHPDLARIYLDVRPGDSTSDRFARAKALARLQANDTESRLMLGRAALDTRDFSAARQALRPLVEGDARPTARTCLMMAQLEETEKGATGAVREWLARASRAPRDKAWVADGVISDTWAPVSPVTGQIDAFEWRTPNEQLSAAAVDWQPAEAAPPAPAADIAQIAAPESASSESAVPLAIAPPPTGEAHAAAIAGEPHLREHQAVETKAGVSLAAPRRLSTPVIFPRPNAPDDPGPADSPAKPQFGFLARD